MARPTDVLIIRVKITLFRPHSHYGFVLIWNLRSSLTIAILRQATAAVSYCALARRSICVFSYSRASSLINRWALFAYRLPSDHFSSSSPVRSAKVMSTSATHAKPVEDGVASASAASNAAHNGLDSKEKEERIVWVDCEMTGLDIDKDHLLEVACLVTNKDLSIVDEGINLIIHQPDDVLNAMGEWCTEHHGQSGLTEAVRRSTISLTDAENQLVEYIKPRVVTGMSPLAGNTIFSDRVFLKKFMPAFNAQLHYRHVDVSTLSQLIKRWKPEVAEMAPVKKKGHRALDDIWESVEQLKYYKAVLFG